MSQINLCDNRYYISLFFFDVKLFFAKAIMSISTAFDVHDEVNRLSDIEDDEKLTEYEVTNLFTYFNNTDNLSSVKKALIKSKPDKNKLRYLRNLLISGMSLKI